MRRKSKGISFFVTEKDYLKIKEKAMSCGKNLTAYLTACGLQKNIIVLNGIESLVGQMKRIGQHLNRLTVLADTGKIQTVYLNEAANALHEINGSIQILLQKRNR